MDVGVDEEGNKNYFEFMMHKKKGLLGGPLVAYLQVKPKKTIVGFYSSETDPVERDKWSFEGEYPKNLQDVCDIIKSARFYQMLKKSPDKTVSYIVTYVHFPASRGRTK